jgi:hypothetical protein
VGREEVRLTYKKLKGVRSKIRKHTRMIKKALSDGKFNESAMFEEELTRLTKTKTRLRKKFERLTGIKGPYSR